MFHDLEVSRRVVRAEAYALDLLAASFDDKFEAATELLWNCGGKVIVSGMGKSGLIGRKIAATFQSTGTPAAFLHPADAAHGDMGMIGAGDLLLALSNSGETDEMRPVLARCRILQNKIVVVTSGAESSFAREADAAIIMPQVPEGCPIGRAPMASAAMTLGVGDALAACLMARRGFGDRDFLALHHGGYLGRMLVDMAA